MADYTIVATYEYDNFGGFWVESPMGLQTLPAPITYNDTDTTLSLGEDVSGGGNQVMGYITIDSVDYPVVTGSGGDTTNPLVLVPQGTDPNTVNFPTPVDTNNTVTSPFVEAAFEFCFAAGTMISTPEGETAVEKLSIGDLVVNADGHTVPVRWIGRQTLAPRFANERTQLVRIARGALAEGLPHTDLLVTGGHGMVIDGLVINASALVNGTTITRVSAGGLFDRVTVYHVETEGHDVILANGAPAETFIDYADRKAFDNYAEYLKLYGDETIISEMPMPRVSSARLVPPAIRARLSEAAAA